MGEAYPLGHSPCVPILYFYLANDNVYVLYISCIFLLCCNASAFVICAKKNYLLCFFCFFSFLWLYPHICCLLYCDSFGLYSCMCLVCYLVLWLNKRYYYYYYYLNAEKLTNLISDLTLTSRFNIRKIFVNRRKCSWLIDRSYWSGRGGDYYYSFPVLWS